MEPVIKWLDQIEDLSLKFIMFDNLTRTPHLTIDIPINKMSQALSSAFMWLNSPQGFNFWDNIHRQICNLEDSNDHALIKLLTYDQFKLNDQTLYH